MGETRGVVAEGPPSPWINHKWPLVSLEINYSFHKFDETIWNTCYWGNETKGVNED